MDDALPNILKSKIPKRRNAIFETKLAKMTQVKLKIPRFKSKKLNQTISEVQLKPITPEHADRNQRKQILAGEKKMAKSRMDLIQSHKSIKLSNLYHLRLRERFANSKKILNASQSNIEAQSETLAVLHKNKRILEWIMDSYEDAATRVRMVNAVDQRGRRAIHYAAFLSVNILVEMLLVGGAKTNVQDKLLRNPMHYASMKNNEVVIEMLLSTKYKEVSKIGSIAGAFNLRLMRRGASPEPPSPLAAQKEKESNVKYIEEYREIDYNQLYERAVKKIKQMDVVLKSDSIKKLKKWKTISKSSKSLLKKEQSKKIWDMINSQDINGRIPLHFAVVAGNFSIVRLLLREGSDVFLEDDMGNRPIDLANDDAISNIIFKKMQKMDQYSVLNDRDMEILPLKALQQPADKDGNTLVILAVKEKNQKALRMLMDRGSKLTDSNNKGWNVLHFAIQNNDLSALSYLLEGGVRTRENLSSFQYKDRPQAFRQWILDIYVLMSGWTDRNFNLLHICAIQGDVDISEYILKNYILRCTMFEEQELLPVYLRGIPTPPYKYYLEQKDHLGNTPLLLAIQNKNLDGAKLLLEYGANEYAQNTQGQNILHISTSSHQKEVIKYIIDYDADKNILRNSYDVKHRKPQEFDIIGDLTPLYTHIWDWAASGDIKKIQQLLRKGLYTIDQQTKKQKDTPLHVAIKKTSITGIRALVQLGARQDIQNAAGLMWIDQMYECTDSSFFHMALRLLNKQQLLDEEYTEQELEEFYSKYSKPIKNRRFRLTKTENKYSENAKEIAWTIKQRLLQKGMTLMDAFAKVNGNLTGVLQYYEFEKFLKLLGIEYDEDTLYKYINGLDLGKNDVIEYYEIVRHFQKSAGEIEMILDDEVKFKALAKLAFDSVDEDDSGFIDEDELKEVMIQVSAQVGCPAPTDEDVIKVMKAYDADGNGVIDLEEFEVLIKSVLSSMISKTNIN